MISCIAPFLSNATVSQSQVFKYYGPHLTKTDMILYMIYGKYYILLLNVVIIVLGVIRINKTT